MSQTSVELLEELTQADAIPGHEGEVRQIFNSHLDERWGYSKGSIGKHFLHEEWKCCKAADPA